MTWLTAASTTPDGEGKRSKTGEGVDELGSWLLEQLGVVRVYTKIPGQPVDRRDPYALRLATESST